MFQKLSEKIDAENFVHTFLDHNEPTICVVMNQVAYEKDELDSLIKVLTGYSDKYNLGISMQIHPMKSFLTEPVESITSNYFVMLTLEKV